MQPGGRGALPWPEDSDAATAATRSALAYPDDEWQRKGATLSDKTVWVPIIHPCWSGSMPVLVEGASEPVPSADIELRDPLTIGNRLG